MLNPMTRRLSWRILPVLALSAGAALLLQPARAQLALPGAVAPEPAGTVASPTARAAAKKARRSGGGDGGGETRSGGVIVKPPSEDSIVGKPLTQDGSRSAIEFHRNGGAVQVSRLTLSGDRLSRSGESCRIDVAGAPLALKPVDSENGLHRYQVDFPACPFSFEILDGAVLASNEGKACELKQADCRSDPAGLWGMAQTEFDPKKSKDMLGARARVEKTVRANFHALFDRYKKDKPLRDVLVRDQAGFSSLREEICRSYANESDYGYCALRITEARAVTLAAQIAHGVKRPPGLPTPEEASAAAKEKHNRKR